MKKSLYVKRKKAGEPKYKEPSAPTAVDVFATPKSLTPSTIIT